MVRRVAAGFVTVVIGSVCAAASYWGLLNVPESNVLALLASALLALLTIVVAALTASTVLAMASGLPVGAALRRSPVGLAAVVVGLLIFGMLWWASTSVDAAWAQHRGEIDALFLRYVGTARTAWLHTSAAWVMWLVRWALGLSITAALAAAALNHGVSPRALGRGLRAAFGWRTLGTTIIALLIGRALWPLAYWRPRGLPTTAIELAFVTVKLGILFAAAALLLVIALQVFARGARPTPVDRIDAAGSPLQTRS